MTTPADIDAIRERADAKQWDYQRQLNYLIEQRDHNPMMANHRSQSSLNGQIGNLMQKLEPYADIAVLVDAHAQLAERVRTLEAALRPFADCLDEMSGWENDVLIPHEWLKQAADALAANADAGNGGA